ncbi:uncharacterized protein LOC126376410 [Pectinophora gossypiella]|uniref:uncharacterized protein LOC126376410 n=1 Tax=Pectinophora gossypiella TaxID=13191 RepID=UPI00214F363F|nr:uncharacterized protein LOC126376410 [Pectinophora gossypiella]
MLEFNSDTIECVRKVYNLDEHGRIEEVLDLFEEWVKKQEHFIKKDFSRGYLERMIIGSKGSVERAKGRLEKLCTYRTLMPNFFTDFDVKDFKHLDDKIIHVVLPKLTPDHDRIMVARYVGKKFNPKMVSDGFKVCLLYAEYIRAHDYGRAAQVVIDFHDASVTEVIKNLNVLELKQLFNILIEGHGIRVAGVHIITESKLIDALVAIAKQVLSDKLFSRVRVHKTVDTLLEVIPKEVLARELGGSERSMRDINAEWMKIFGAEEFKSYWKEMCGAKTDESLRQTDKFNDQYMGMPGTFRTLTVD